MNAAEVVTTTSSGSGFLSLIFCLLGGIFTLIAAGYAVYLVNRARTWRRETGTAVGQEFSTSSDGDRMSHLVLERTDATGTTHRRVSAVGTSGLLRPRKPFPYDVELMVHPTDETRFDAVQRGVSTIFIGLLGGIGLLFLVVGILV